MSHSAHQGYWHDVPLALESVRPTQMLCERLHDPDAAIYLYRLWRAAHLSEENRRFTGDDGVGAIERLCLFRGRRGRLTDALHAAGFLLIDGESYVVVPWRHVVKSAWVGAASDQLETAVPPTQRTKTTSAQRMRNKRARDARTGAVTQPLSLVTTDVTARDVPEASQSVTSDASLQKEIGIEIQNLPLSPGAGTVHSPSMAESVESIPKPTEAVAPEEPPRRAMTPRFTFSATRETPRGFWVPEAVEVFDHYAATHQPKAHLTRTRHDLILRMFREGYSVDDLKRAIGGYRHSRHHNGENDKKAKYLDVEHMIDGAKRIEAGWNFLASAQVPMARQVIHGSHAPAPKRDLAAPIDADEARANLAAFRPSFLGSPRRESA